MATFPHGYTKILADGYEKEREEAVQRTPMDDGMVKQLRTKSRVLVKRTMTLGFDSLTDYQNFITWFQDDTDYGELWFDFTDPEDSVVKLARIVERLDRERPIFGTNVWRISVMIETWSAS